MAEESFKERARQEMIKAAKQYKDIYVDYEYLICSVTFVLLLFGSIRVICSPRARPMSQCPEKLLRKQLSLPSKQLCFLESYYKHFGASPQFTNRP